MDCFQVLRTRKHVTIKIGMNKSWCVLSVSVVYGEPDLDGLPAPQNRRDC